jgi:hypothetical protein
VVDPAQQTELMRGIGVSSFPAIFLGSRYIGGFTHIVHLITQGRLQGLAQTRPR